MPKDTKLKYTIQSILICDDARRENTGKEILIGVYGNEIIISSKPPTNLSPIFIRVTFVARKRKFRNCVLEVYDPSGDIVAKGKGVVAPKKLNEPMAVSLPVGAIHIPRTGVYTIKFGMDVPPRKVGEFRIKYKKPDNGS